jgi:hypothetical protein
VTPRNACALAAVAALAASAGDVLLLWYASGGRPDLPMLPPIGGGALVAGHYLGVLAIPLYAFGYWGVAQAIRPRRLPEGGPSRSDPQTSGADRAARERAAQQVFLAGAFGAAYGAAVHGITAIAEHAGRGAAGPATPASILGPYFAFLGPLWIALAALALVGSVVYTRAVASGATLLPRRMALASPVALCALAALLAAPTPLGRALLVPAAPNVAHLWFFALAALALDPGRRPELRGP